MGLLHTDTIYFEESGMKKGAYGITGIVFIVGLAVFFLQTNVLKGFQNELNIAKRGKVIKELEFVVVVPSFNNDLS